ncbi:MAG: glycoside hydrolase family 2 TIM barrel-domain containing protein [Eubacteriales bacterium]|nr:glycoside hydrolase family 2 TIM barrel-domain containing protein [Eubacteriales bacterium]
MKASLSWLEDPRVFRVNRLDAHSDHRYYETEEDMKAQRESLRQSLNGTWRFCWSKNPSLRPEDFYCRQEEPEGMENIEVPGHIELQGYGRIQYINNMYPWEGHSFLRPPHIDWTDNPVGSYRKEFDLDEKLAGKRVCISFQGVECAMYVWLNGAFIGYAEDSFTPSEFDLTEHIKKKANLLCVEVYKRSSASWLEDQDFFRFSGIFRDVFLYAKPDIHTENIWVKARAANKAPEEAGESSSCQCQNASGATCESSLSQRQNTCETDSVCGVLEIEANLSGQDCREVLWEIHKPLGEILAQGRLTRTEEILPQHGESSVLWRQAQTEIPGIQLWDVGKPCLYTVVLKLLDGTGKIREYACVRTGFRNFEIRDGVMLLNGKRLEIHGVNRHEWNPRRGRAVTEDDMRRDIEILKRNHINAVRTCHYPNQSLWYELCDEAGICVMDEMNLETHGSWQKMGACEPSWNVPGSLDEWKACVLDRAQSMLERDKNHPCVLWWSCGNESYAGEVLRAVGNYFRKKDPSRLVHYEGVFWNREFSDISDVESRMYAPPEAIREYLENKPGKPFLLCEYMHDMGNSLGGMESYMQLLDEYPMYQGGFIWDYVDQALYHRNAQGQEVLGYGGDFLDRPTDYAFSANGILFADRTEKPAMQEVRYWYSSREERHEADRRREDARRAAAERIAAERAREAEIAAECIAGEDAGRAMAERITVENAGRAAERADRQNGKLQVIHGDINLGIRGDGFHVIFSYQEAGPVSLVYGGQECLYRAPRPAFWRAATENDRGNGFAVHSSIWMAAEMYCKCVECSVTEYTADRRETLRVTDFAGRKPASEEIEKVKIHYLYVPGALPQVKVSVDYTVDGSGRIRVDVNYSGREGLPQLPLFGLRFVLPWKEKVVWEGLSGETYPDRQAGGYFGVHTEKPAVPAYLVPQECGNHMGTCWMQTGSLRFEMEREEFMFSALPYTPLELESALHREELPESERTVVSILGRMRGVGGIDSWGADVERTYHVPSNEDISYSFFITRSRSIELA